MSVPPQIVRSSPEAPDGGSLAVGSISLSPLAGEGETDIGAEVLWQDDERVFCRGWRLGEGGGRSAVLVILPVAAHPSPSSLDRLAHELGLKEELGAAWAVRPLEIVRHDGRTMLVLEDIGGFEPLDRVLAAPMEVDKFLRLAVNIAVALGKAHERGLVHKDVKPANILVNGGVRLTGFGVASRLPRERQAIEPPEVIAGTLAYMAPEQTGRMNRSIDSRSDLYALGVTFYQMLTGVLPFSAADPLEWVHCHIARTPAPPTERLATVPVALSQLVMKLLAKTAEDRYQTAVGLEHDLRRCLLEWERDRRIDPFPLGERDAPDRLMIPETLYGREREVEALLAAFDRVVGGAPPELVLASGYSGIGKSSVVNELHKALIPRRGLFASGKFDQLRSNIPYSTLAQAFQSLVRSLLGKSDAELASWREALREALEPNGRLIADLVPELALIIGEQPPVPELEPQQAKGRFQLVLRRFIGVFARLEHPLTLFLDDLQWLDAATLDFIEDILTRPDLRSLMLIGAYRDNEVDDDHPLMRKLSAIRMAGGTVNDIKLGPLKAEHVRQLIADALRSTAGDAAPLAELVQAKTAGNPFFVLQFLHALADEGLLAFDHEAQRWSWDLDQIRAKGYADNVVDLMVGKLLRLPRRTRKALQALACLGNAAKTELLSPVLERPQDDVHADLLEALREELVQRVDSSYRFVHDRVQEAAYSLVPETSRAGAHLRIGRLLLERTPEDKREEAIFEIVSQLNRGESLISSREEREQLAGFNLAAGKRAKASAAYASALNYLTAGATLLADDRWARQHELAFALEMDRAACEFLTGEYAAAELRLVALSERAAGAVEQASVACLRIDLYTTLGQFRRAVAAALDWLRELGIDWPERPSAEEVRSEYERLRAALGDRAIEELIDLPLMSDPASRATLDILTKVGASALEWDSNLCFMTICRSVNLSLQHGNCDGSCVPYVGFGMIAGPLFGNYEAGFRFARLGYELVENRGLKRFMAGTYLHFATLIMPYTTPIRAGRDLLRRAFEAANKIGDLAVASYYWNSAITNMLAAGDPLLEVQREAEKGLSFVQKARFRVIEDVLGAQLGFVRALRGLTPIFGCFDDDLFDEVGFEQYLAGDPGLAAAEAWYWVRKLQARFIACDYAAAADASSKAQGLRWTWIPFFETVEFRFYSALALAARCTSAEPSQRRQYLEAVAAHFEQLEIWAKHCPETFDNRVALVGAEIARIEGREADAMRLYGRAIRSASANGFVNNEALANEAAGRFYLGVGLETPALAYLNEARRCYALWGADGKVKQLDERYPHLNSSGAAAVPGGAILAPIEQLDLATVIKVSQAVSGEIALEKLIDTLMRTAVEQAGAERGLLILSQAAETRIAAEATTSGDTINIELRDAPVTASALPETVLHYVLHTREGVILEDAAARSPFASDPYISQSRARSVLCLPLLNQSRLVGLLYLENNLAPLVFAPRRVAVLKLLSSQAATALENTRLYGDLAEREAKIRRLVDANIIGIFTWHIPRLGPEKDEGFFLEVNDAFLRMLGYEREDFISGRLRRSDVTPPEWRERDIRTVAELRESGVLRPYEKEYLAKDGSRVPVLVGGACFDDTRTHGVAFVIDLSERKRAETELRRSEARLEKAQRIAHVGWWERDFVTNRVSLSDEASRIFGMEPVDLPDWHDRWLNLIHPQDRPRTAAAAAAALRGGSRYDVEYRVVRPDGALRIVHSQGDVTWDDSGRPQRQFGVMQDLTELRQAEQELRASESRFRTFVDYAKDAFCLHDEQLTILDVNQQACVSLGYSREELIGMHPRIFDVGLDEASIERLRQRVVAGETLTFETLHRRKDGTVFPVEIRAAQFEQFGRRRHLILARDITERKQAEEQSERLRELESNLAHVNRLSMMGELTASLAHEILHPIATARNNARAATRFLEMKPPNLGEVGEALSCIVRDADRAKDIVDRVRDHIKKAPPRKVRFQVNEAIGDVIGMARSAIDRNKVSVRTDFASNAISVEGDRVQLQQVILNLILNAVEAMSSVEGARELSIRTEQSQTNDILVAVRDSGPGIDREHFERVFDPFYTTKTSGVGMGLAICRSIIDAHGGRLWVEANEPRGAAFRFTMPAAHTDL